MPDNNNDILKQLQSYRVEPSAILFDKVWQNINININTQRDSVLMVPVMGITTNNVEDDEDISGSNKSMKALRHYELSPPPFDFNAIVNSETTDENQPPLIPLHSKKSLTFLYKIAAAVLIVTASIWGYNSMRKKDIQPIVASTDVEKSSSATSEDIQKKMEEQINVSTSSLNKHNTAKRQLHLIRTKHNMPVLTSDAQLIKPTDNDLFFTLVNYTYKESNAFINNNKQTQKIKLDQFSYVTVSDKMAVLLKSMYSTKKNSRPTWKAKRMKAKLNKWKKEDEKNFDLDASQNPIDAIDLSEFIFK